MSRITFLLSRNRMDQEKKREKDMYIEPGSTVCTRADIDRYKVGWTLEVKKKRVKRRERATKKKKETGELKHQGAIERGDRGLVYL
jgi:hypothetical protein